MINRLVIHRFRGIREGTIEDFGKINVLIGPNNSGKTAILEMLHLAGVSGRKCEVLIPDVEPSAWEATTLNRRDFLYKEPMPNLRERHNEPKVWNDSPAALTDEYTLSIELAHIPKNYPLRKFTLAAPPEEGGRKPAFGKHDITRVSMFRLLPNTVTVPEPLMPDYFDRKGVTLKDSSWVYLWEDPWVYRWNKAKPADYFAIWAIEGQIPNADRVLFFDLHTAIELFEQGFTKLTYRKVKNWESTIAAHLGNVFPELQGARVNIKPHVGNKWTGFIEFPDKEPIPVDHFGDGARHAFKILAAVIALREPVSEERPGLFLWEDPELFMHPATLGHLLNEVIDLVKDVPIQVFLTTQSLEVLAWFVNMVEQGHPCTNEFRVYRLNLKQGTLETKPFVSKGIASWFRLFGDPRLTPKEEMASPLYNLLKDTYDKNNGS